MQFLHTVGVDSEHRFDASGFISVVGEIDVHSRPRMTEKDFFACGFVTISVTRTCQNKLSAKPFAREKAEDLAGTVSVQTT